MSDKKIGRRFAGLPVKDGKNSIEYIVSSIELRKKKVNVKKIADRQNTSILRLPQHDKSVFAINLYKYSMQFNRANRKGVKNIKVKFLGYFRY